MSVNAAGPSASSRSGNGDIRRSASTSSVDHGQSSHASGSREAVAGPSHERSSSIDSPAKLTRSHHHPYRLEVSAVTPVSVLLSWSLRPQPLSAIPRSSNVAAGKQAAGAQGSSSVQASTSASPVVQRSKRNSGDARRHLASTSTVTATRGPNRKVTKVTLLRNASPGKTLEGHSRGSSDGHKRPIPGSPTLNGELAPSRRGSEDWPSEDGVVVGDEDEDREFATSRRGRSNDSAVTVVVNGVPWRQVLMGDGAGEDETFVAVYGLAPGRKYDIVLAIEDQQSKVQIGTPQDTSIETPAPPAVEALRDASATIDSTSSDDNHGRVYRTHTPPMQDTDGDSPGASFFGPIGATSQDTAATHPLAANGTGVSASALQAAIRKAKKDASRAESAMRSEIDAIKKGLDRMSDVDHRSKQKVLALQESIRQATIQTKRVDEEASAVENERESWEARDLEKGEELEAVRQEIEGKMRVSDAAIKSDNEHVASLDRDLARAAKSLEEKRAAKEKLEKERVVELETELSRIQSEIDKVLKQPTPPPPHFTAPAAHYHNQFGSQGMHHSAPPLSSNFNGSSQGHIGPAFQHPHGAPSLIQPQALGRGGRGRGVGSAMLARNSGLRGSVSGAPTWRGGSLNHGPQTRSAYYGGAFPSQGPSSAGHTSDEQHQISYDQASPMGSHTLLNPNKPEFVPGHGNAGSHSPSASVGKLHYMQRPASNSAIGPPSHGHDYYEDDQSSSNLFAPGAQTHSHDSSAPDPMTPWSTGIRAPPATTSPWKHTAAPLAGLPGSPHFGQDIWGVNSVPSPQHRPSPLIGGGNMPPSTSSPLHMHGPLDSGVAPSNRYGSAPGSGYPGQDKLQGFSQQHPFNISGNASLPGFSLSETQQSSDVHSTPGPLGASGDTMPGRAPLFTRGSDSPLPYSNNAFFRDQPDRRHLEHGEFGSPHNSFSQ